MPRPQLSSEQAARKAIADRLGELRRDAGLTATALAQRCGWSTSKASRIERNLTRPSDTDIHAWCRASNAQTEAADLIAASRTADSMYREWRRVHRDGLKRRQTVDVPLYQRTRHTRVYVSNVVPGLLQTQPYAEALMSAIADFEDVRNDASEAAAARVERSRVLHDGSRRFAFLFEEDVLHYPFGGAEVMAGQLDAILAAMSLPNVSIGIIPRGTPRTMWTLEGFLIFGAEEVQVETLSADLAISRPSEISTYLRAFERLAGMAVYGPGARRLVLSARPHSG